MKCLKLCEEFVGFAILTATTAFFSALVIFLNVLEFLFAFFGASVVTQFR